MKRIKWVAAGTLAGSSLLALGLVSSDANAGVTKVVTGYVCSVNVTASSITAASLNTDTSCQGTTPLDNDGDSVSGVWIGGAFADYDEDVADRFRMSMVGASQTNAPVRITYDQINFLGSTIRTVESVRVLPPGCTNADNSFCP